MAVLHVNYYSPALKNNTDLMIFIPTPQCGEPEASVSGSAVYGSSKFPVLYLLHGTFGDYTDWLRLTGIERMAQKHRVMLVMPSARNDFYCDAKDGPAWEQYFLSELPEFILNTFPASPDREKNYIGGISLGGYGAFRFAMLAPEKFSRAASFSGTIDMDAFGKLTREGCFPDPYNWRTLYGNEGTSLPEEKDIFFLYKKQAQSGKKMPSLFMTVGKEDALYASSVKAASRLRDEGADLLFTDDPGIHDWDFWDSQIEKMSDWLFNG